MKSFSEVNNPLSLEGLEKNEQEMVVYELAKSRTTPAELLREIAEGEYDLTILEAIADNPNTPPDVLRGLVHSEATFITYALIRNRNTPKDVLETIANDFHNFSWSECAFAQKRLNEGDYIQ